MICNAIIYYIVLNDSMGIEQYNRYAFLLLLEVARGFPRCKPNRIVGKMLENKMSENGKPEKMPDVNPYPNREWSFYV